MKECFYALGGLNYKNGFITTCPRQADQLVFANETTLPSEIYNHENIKELRRKLYNDQWPSGCDTCEDMGRDGLRSMRLDFSLIDNWFYKSEFKEKREGSNRNRFAEQIIVREPFDNLMSLYNDKTHEVGFKGLRHVEIRFSNACNFACLHCSKVFSTGWSRKLQNYVPDKEVLEHDLKQLRGTEHRHGPDDKGEIQLSTENALKIIEDLNENFPNVEFIDFAGGELLYQKQFFPTLRKLAEHPNAKNMLISFHTNFNADFSVEELTEALKPFNETCIIISVDSGRNTYPYFRHGGYWDKLKQNIRDFKKINTFTHIDVSITTSVYQILDLYDVFDSMLELDCHLDASIVQSPPYINPSTLMHKFKEEVLGDFEKTFDMLFDSNSKYIEGERGAKAWLKYIFDYILKTNIDEKQYNKFLGYRKKSDEIWQQNFNDYFKNYQIVNNELVRA